MPHDLPKTISDGMRELFFQLEELECRQTNAILAQKRPYLRHERILIERKEFEKTYGSDLSLLKAWLQKVAHEASPQEAVSLGLVFLVSTHRAEIPITLLRDEKLILKLRDDFFALATPGQEEKLSCCLKELLLSGCFSKELQVSVEVKEQILHLASQLQNLATYNFEVYAPWYNTFLAQP